MARLATVLAVNTIVFISRNLIRETVDVLRASEGSEHVALWIGSRSDAGITVTEVFVPIQVSSKDFFHIPRSGMSELLSRLSQDRQLVAAQIHTHPHEAFHSAADDRWATVCHVGGLSLVIPRFCRDTTVENFLRNARAFKLDRAGRFVACSAQGVCRVTP